MTNRPHPETLRHVEIFEKLTDEELLKVVELCWVERVPAGQIIFHEGEDGDTLFLIQQGCVRISLNTRGPEDTLTPGTINMLYAGQSFGEMVLLGGITRSATVTAVDDCVLLVLKAHEFAALCEANPRIGYRVIYSVAGDLAYKLRSSNLLLRGNIRWQGNELSRRTRKNDDNDAATADC